MAYRLTLTNDLAGSVRACAHEQLADAIAQLGSADADQAEAIHEARKDLKKARALLRLVRPALGRKAYRRENAALREIGGALSAARDADVLAETAARLAERGAGRLPADTFTQLREALAAEAGGGGADGGIDREAVLGALHDAEARVASWRLEPVDRTVVVAGIGQAYARGRAAFASARKQPTPERLHEWRKRAKDLWYHERLLAPAWPALLGAQAEEAHVLTELLGDDHDLAVLAARLAAPEPLSPAVDAERSELLALVGDRSAELRVAATRLGRRVYAESPKAFARRVDRYIRVAADEQRGDGG